MLDEWRDALDATEDPESYDPVLWRERLASAVAAEEADMDRLMERREAKAEAEMPAALAEIETLRAAIEKLGRPPPPKAHPAIPKRLRASAPPPGKD